MSNRKISELSDGGALQDTDEVIVARSGQNYRIAGSEIGGSQPVTFGYDTLVIRGDDDATLYTIGIDGRGMRQATFPTLPNETDRNGSFEPTERRLIVFSRDYDAENRDDVFVVDTITGVETNLTADFLPGGTGHHGAYIPAYSPDGAKIVFEAQDASVFAGIWTMNADGTGKTQIVPTETFTSGASVGSIGSPAWSPDGSQIAFSVWGQETSADGIYVVDADGGNLTQIISPADFSDPEGFFIYNVAWSSKNLLAFAPETNADWLGIYTCKPDGSDLAVLGDAAAFQPGIVAWSPDGTRLIAGDYDAASASIVIDLAGNISHFAGGNVFGSPPSWGQAGDGAQAGSYVGPLAEHVADGSTVDQLRDALIAAGVMKAA